MGGLQVNSVGLTHFKIRSIGLACAVATSVLAVAPAVAQPTPATQQAAIATPTLSHTFAKSTTLAAGSTAVIITIFALGTGDLASAAVLTGGTIAAMYTIYPVNEYVWDHFVPAHPATAENGSFDVAASLWRNTAKYITWKAGIMGAKFAWIYAYTGSFTSTLTLGGATSIALPVLFYMNNVAWDWYDWLQQHPSQATHTAQP